MTNKVNASHQPSNPGTQGPAAASPLFNEAQTILLQTYATGDFEHLLEAADQTQLTQELADCGDGLLRFLMIELSSSEDCENLDEAQNRVRQAIEDLEALSRNLAAA